MADVPTTVTDEPAPPRLFFVPKRTRNLQIAKLTKHFGHIAAADAALPKGLRFVFLCFTQRCGSTYLAQLIGSGGQYNVPREYLNHEHVIARSAKRNLTSFADYFSDLARADAKQGRIFIKVTPLHLGLLQEAGLLGRIVGCSDFVLIERGDKLAQAISFAIARETGKYTSNMQSRKSEADLVYQREAITKLLNSLVDSYKQFDMFFGLNGIVPVNIVYEQLVANPMAALKLISDRLGIAEFTIKEGKVRNARQAGDTNAAWRTLFLRGEGLPLSD
jgi:LPS sulfotransferase NodH